jgi:hypothetical protein
VKRYLVYFTQFAKPVFSNSGKRAKDAHKSMANKAKKIPTMADVRAVSSSSSSDYLWKCTVFKNLKPMLVFYSLFR